MSTFCADIKHKLSLAAVRRPWQLAAMGIGVRIADARKARGWSQTRLAEAIGTGQTTVSSWERDRTEPTRSDVQRIATVLGVPVAQLELADPQAEAEAGFVPVVGYVGAGAVATLYAEGQGELDRVEAPIGSSAATVAAEVRGVSLGPAFDGSLIFYDDVRSPVTPDLHGRLCVVGLLTGQVLVKILRAGSNAGQYHLLSNTAEEPLWDQEVIWAARVKDIRPR